MLEHPLIRQIFGKPVVEAADYIRARADIAAVVKTRHAELAAMKAAGRFENGGCVTSRELFDHLDAGLKAAGML
jgi:hypothetical protein